LANGLYGAICEQPGATMKVLSKAIGQRSEALALPASKLVRSGSVRKTGQRQHTRYFPVGRQPPAKRMATKPA
jgi:hypothetical protein